MESARQARSTRSNAFVFAACTLVCVASVVAGCSDDGASPSTTGASTRAQSQETNETRGQAAAEGDEQKSAQTKQALYALQPTLRCLKRYPRLATTTRPTTPRLRAMRDLAQRTSVVARLGGEDVGMAVVRSDAHAALLAELLRAPGDPHRIIRRRNAVLIFLPRARDAFDVVAGCLRTAR